MKMILGITIFVASVLEMDIMFVAAVMYTVPNII